MESQAEMPAALQKINSLGITNANDRRVMQFEIVQKAACAAVSAGFIKQQNQCRFARLQFFE